MHASEATLPGGNDFAKAIQAKNLKKVDPEEEKKRREQSQQNRCELTACLSFSTLLYHSCTKQTDDDICWKVLDPAHLLFRLIDYA